MKRLGAIAFPGQGGQHYGMLKQMYNRNERVVSRILEECDAAVNQRISTALIDETPQTKFNIHHTQNAQPLMVAYGYAVFQTLQQHQEELHSISHVLGHSLGEFTAMAANNHLTLYDTIRLVRKRGLAMQEAAERYPNPCGMSTLLLFRNTTIDSVREELAKEPLPVCIAIINAVNQIVLSGDTQGIANVVGKLGRGVRAKPLSVSGAFHSPVMNSARDVMKSTALRINYPGKYTFVSNMTARPVTSAEEVRGIVNDTTTTMADWLGCVRYVESEVDYIYQIGAGKLVQAACGGETKVTTFT